MPSTARSDESRVGAPCSRGMTPTQLRKLDRELSGFLGNRPASDVAGGIAGVEVVVDPDRNVEAG